MADTKISALTASTTPLAGTEVLPIVQSGTTKQVSVANLTAGRPISASAVGAGVASPATQLHAQGSNANLGTLELDSDPSVDFVGLTMWTKKTVPNANSRNWQVAANYQGFGTFDILNSTTTTGNPTTARFSMDNVGNATLNTGNLVIGTSGKGIAGTTTNDNADGGVVGQFVASSVATATLTTAAADIASISLTAGDWDVTYIASSGGVGATCTAVLLSINTTSATVGTQVDDNIWVTADPINGLVGGVFTKRLSLSATTTVYGISRTVAGTVSVFQAKITARRRR